MEEETKGGRRSCRLVQFKGSASPLYQQALTPTSTHTRQRRVSHTNSHIQDAGTPVIELPNLFDAGSALSYDTTLIEGISCRERGCC